MGPFIAVKGWKVGGLGSGANAFLALLLLERGVTARLYHDDVKADSCRGVEARRSKLAGDAIAINHLLPVAALASDRVGVAARTAYAVLAKGLDGDARADRFGAFDCFLDCCL